jgi:hypothetical protein
VVLDVDVYAASGGKGNKLGILRAGSVVRFSGACPKDWCNVASEAVPTGQGWVYNGPDYRALKF